MDERSRFIEAWLEHKVPVSRLCETFRVSRTTGYYWINRFHAEGRAGLAERSRAPHTSPQAMSAEAEKAILEARALHPTWGPRKLLAWMRSKESRIALPAASSAGELLKKYGLVQSRRRRRTLVPATNPLASCDTPNAVWCADFKGEFNVGGVPCYPLTITDGHSRFLLCCKGLHGTDEAPVRRQFERVFREYGLPAAIRTDNGTPFAAARAPAGLSRLAAWWIRLGIVPDRIAPGKPQQNGRHERMHKTLKAETALPPQSSMDAQQSAFDRFRDEFNHERPHEALAQRPPATAYQPSARPFPRKLPELEYPTNVAIRRVHNVGKISWQNREVYVSMALAGEDVGVLEVEDGVCTVSFGPVTLGVLADRLFVPVAAHAYRRSQRRRGSDALIYP